jgi:CRP-like cAMP-binding protein
VLPTELQRFDAFTNMDEVALARVAENTSSLTLPANRWLTRSGRNLRGAYYLLRGRVRTHQPDGVIAEGDPRARQPIVPGAVAVKTLAPSQLLAVDAAALNGPNQCRGIVDVAAELALLVPQRLDPGWEYRFLTQNVVQPLGPNRWQRIFRDMQARRYMAGEAVIVQGEAAADFFVIRSGVARVCRDAREVARLLPGDFFGEDALVLDTTRNATVTMIRSGVVMAISREVFVEEMLTKLLLAGGEDPGAVPLFVGVGSLDRGADGVRGIPLADLRLRAPGLDRTQRYQIVGDTATQAVLGAFLLLQAGHRVTAKM